MVSTTNNQQVIIDIDDSPPDYAVFTPPSSSKTACENVTSQPPMKESLLAIFQLLYSCKLATSDSFLKEKCRDINILDGSFYINTLQSLKYSDYLISLADSVIDYTDKLRAPPLNVGQLLHLMSIPKSLLKDSKEKRELMVGIIRNYDDNLKSLKKISESIKKHKKDLIKGRETMPSKEVEYEKYKGKSESCSKNSEKFIYLGAGLAFCNTFYIITILLDGRMGFLTAYSSIFLMTIISLFVLFLGVKFRFDSTEYSKVSEEIKVNLDVIKRLIENTNDTEIKAIELNVVSLIRRIPVVLEYWKDYKESLEGLIVVFNAGGHNFDPSQMGDKWREIKNCLEDYGHIVRDVLEQNDLLNGKDSKNN